MSKRYTIDDLSYIGGATLQYINLLKQVYHRYGIPDPNKHIEDLFNSVYSAQENDYVMLRHRGYSFPVDKELYPLIQHLMRKGINLGRWNYKDSTGMCFFTVMNDNYDTRFRSNDSIESDLCGMFGSNNVYVDYGGSEKRHFQSDKVYICRNHDEWDFITVVFSHHMVEFLNEKCKTYPLYGTILPGSKSILKMTGIKWDKLNIIRGRMHHVSVKPEDIWLDGERIMKTHGGCVKEEKKTNKKRKSTAT